MPWLGLPRPSAGKLTSSKDLAKKLERVSPYLKQGSSGKGGITISGGEPLLQARGGGATGGQRGKGGRRLDSQLSCCCTASCGFPCRLASVACAVSTPPCSHSPTPGLHALYLPPLQPEFTASVLMEAHARGLTTCIDTTGQVGWRGCRVFPPAVRAT